MSFKHKKNKNIKSPIVVHRCNKNASTKSNRQKINPQTQNILFSSMKVKKGSKWSNSVEQKELFFPKLATESKTKSNEIESMWMVGCMHHNKETDESLVSIMNVSFFSIHQLQFF